MAYKNQILYTSMQDISLSYSDLLDILGFEVPEYIASSAEPVSFNVVIRTEEQRRALGLSTTRYLTPQNFNRVSVNGNLLSKIADTGSLALYNIKSVDISFADIDEGDSVTFILSVAYNDTLYDIELTVSYDKVFVSSSAVNESDTSDINSWFLYFDNSTNIHYINIDISNTEYYDYVYVNTYSITNIKKIIRDTYIETNKILPGIAIYGKTARLYVDSRCIEPFTIRVTIDRNILKTYNYKPAKINISGMQYKRAPKMSNSSVSYGLLRANPKLTGNIKVVIDSNSDIYLDTFKVSETLQQKRYRHIKIGYNDYYGEDVMTKFRSVPSSELYKVNTDCFNIFTTVQNYSMQFYDTYNYGVKTNNDLLYPENFAFLAPLCIKNVLPDFFLIFKIDKSQIDEREMSDTELIDFYFKNGILIKSYDMRLDSNIGTYIRTIRDKAAEKTGDIYVSYDTRSYNRYNGISVDRGVVTSLYESPVQQNYVNNQVALNDFYTLGFERNRLVSKDIVNFEFMFDDIDEELFSINTYFGIYVKVNGQDNTFSCIGSHREGVTTVYDFDTSVYTFPLHTDLTSSEYYSKIIYGLTTPEKFIQLKGSVCDSPYIEDYKLKPYKNIISMKVNQITPSRYKSFIYFSLNDLLAPGDHIRFVDEESNSIYEIIASNEDSIADIDASCLSEITSHYKNDIGNIEMNIFRQSVYVTENDTIAEQVDRIATAVSSINRYFDDEIFGVVRKRDNTLSIMSDSVDICFEFIYASSLMSTDLSELTEYDAKNKMFQFFDEVYADKVILDILSRWQSSNHVMFYPIDFEFVGSRIAYIMKFMQLSNESQMYMVDSSVDLDILKSNTVAYITDDSSVSLYSPVEYTTYSISGNNFIENTVDAYYTPSFDNSQSRLIYLDNPKIVNSEINFYTLVPLNSGVCSIFQVKDFDFDVLDNVSILSRTAGIGDNIGPAGEFAEDNYFGGPILERNEELVQNYINKYARYSDSSIIDNVSTFNEFTNSCIQENYQKSSISLVSPYCCKWSATGTDARGRMLRIMSDSISLLQGDSFFIPYGENYTDDIGIIYSRDSSGFYDKFISKSVNNMSYEPADISNVSQWGITELDSILYGSGSIDDIMYDSSTVSNRFSTVSLSGDNTVEFIASGIRFRIRSTNQNALNLNDCNGFEAAVINVPTSDSNTHTSAVVIDKTHRQMLLIYYNFHSEQITSDEYNICKLDYPNLFSNIYTSEEDGKGTFYTETGLGSLDSSASAIFVVSMKDDTDSYVKMSKVIITGAIDSSADSNSASLTDCYLYADNNSYTLNAETYKQNATANIEPVEYYILSTDKIDNTAYRSQTLENFKSSLDDCAIYVKTAYGVDDLTNLEDILEFEIIDPIVSDRNTGTVKYVHPTQIVPVMKNMLSFDYSPVSDDAFSASDDENTSELLEDVFCTSFDGANIMINGIKNISQQWYNKFTEDNRFCIDNTDMYRMSIDLVHDRSIIKGPWDNDKFFKYYAGSDGSETKENIDGYIAGYEIKSFFASRGINLNGKDGSSVILTDWKNTELSYTDNYIKLNISDTLLNYILFKNSFNYSWNYLGLTNNNYKIQYINNVILPLININNKTKFEVIKSSQSLANFQFSSGYPELYTAVSNVKNQLLIENGKYYIYIYPDENGMYYAKMTIEL